MLKLLLFAVLMYYILKVAARLVRAIQQDGTAPAQRVAPPPGQRAAYGYGPPPKRPRATRDASRDDVEDAVWEDL